MKATKQNQIIWALFDWARTVWPVMIITFVFPNYFVNHVAPTVERGNILWAHTILVSSIFIAIMAPVFGLLSDTLKNSTPWFRFFTLINILCAFSLWFVYPDPSYVSLGMIATIIGTIGFELSGTFYNSYLSNITTPETLSKVSGIAWAMGYFAGILCLLLCLGFLVIPKEPLFGYLSSENASHIRIIGPIVGCWYLLFGLPMLLLKDASPTPSTISLPTLFKRSYKQLLSSVYKAKQTPYILQFLLSRMLYTDGINTLFVFAGIYAASTFNMGFDQIMYFAIACNLSAGIGCIIASQVDPIIGERKTIIISLAALSLSLMILLCVSTLFYFWIFALLATVFVGPLQTSSRSLMAKICPEEAKGEFFGLYALSGRITSFLGPAFLGAVANYTGNDTYGMATILIFLFFGLIGMQYLKIPTSVLLPKVNQD